MKRTRHMQRALDHLVDACHAIDGRMKCNTPEFDALDNLRKSVAAIIDELESQAKQKTP